MSPLTSINAPSGMRRVASVTDGTHGNAELAAHDHRVALGRAHVDDHTRRGDEQRRPRRVGERRHQDVTRLQTGRVVGVHHDPGAYPDDARTARHAG